MYVLDIQVMQTNANQTLDLRPVKSLHFTQHSCVYVVSVSNEAVAFHFSPMFAVCKWPQQHPSLHTMCKPIEEWYRNLLDAAINCFMPIENVISCDINVVECL